MSDAVSQTIVWVNDELGTTLQEARQFLEDYIERPENSSSLSRCADRLHQAHGALKLSEVEGGALLADEMEQVANCLVEDPTNAQRRAEGLDALTRAMVQLPAYMDRVISGGADIPLVLLPLLNDLRAARGQPLLSENTLVLLNLPADRDFAAARRAITPPPGQSLRQRARRLRAQYQSALVGWIRGVSPDSSLAAMADVIGALEDASTEDRCFQLWWITAGVIEALRQGGLESNASVKRLLGQVDLQMRRLVDEGERALEADPPFELINSLLFYAARATNEGKRVADIRKSFSLADLIPLQDDLEDARDSLSAPSVKLMQTVGAAIREDLTRVKDVLDIFVRTGMTRLDELGSQLDLLKKIGDTLGVLGLGGLKDAVQAQTVSLRDIVEGDDSPDEDTLLSIAATLIEVEDNLDSQLVGLIVEQGDAAEDAEDLAEIESLRDFEAVTSAVLRECIINLDRVKDAIVQALEAPLEPHVLDEVPFLLRGVTAGLLMLDRSRAVAAIERVGSNIRRWLAIGDAVPSQPALDRLADAIVSIEFYMETIQSGRSDPMYMLDNAEACLAALDAIPREPIVPPAAAMSEGAETVNLAAMLQESEAVSGAEDERTRIMPPLDEGFVEAATSAAPVEEPTADEAKETPPPRIGPEAGRIDPELLELFIEEAGELAETMAARFPSWQADGDEEALTEVRRQFHTLKGSGRMVGAELIGEFGWSIENLLNRILSGTLERTESIVSFVASAIEAVPSLVEQLESGRAPEIDVAAYVEQANAFAEARPDAEEMLGKTLAGEEVVAEEAGGEMDPILRDIFTKEASGHLETLQQYLSSRKDQPPPHEVTEELHRACHTLSGSANMAGVVPAVAIAAPLNQLIRRLHGDSAGLSDSALKLCKSAADLIGEIIQDIREGHIPSADVSDLAEGLEFEYSEHVLRAEAAEEAESEEPVVPAEVEEPEERETATEEPGAEIELIPLEQEEREEAAVTPEPVVEPVAHEPLQIDPEIAAIFYEEASELLEEAEAALSVWRQQPAAGERLAELQRHLHTLKGGARLAGVMVMGDLSHRLESVVEALAEGRLETSEAVGGLMQQALDELHDMREVVQSGRSPLPPEALLSRIESIVSGERLGAESLEEPEPEAAAEVLESAEPMAEPGLEEAETAAMEPEPEPVSELAEEVPEEFPPEEAEQTAAEELPVEPAEVEVERPAPLLPAEFLPPPAAAAEFRAIHWPTPSAPAEEELAPAPEHPPAEMLPPAASAPQQRAIPWPLPAERPEAEQIEVPVQEAEPVLEEEPTPEAETRPAAVELPPPVSEEQPTALTMSHPAFSRPEVARVDADLLESLLNSAGEVSIFRSRLEQQVGSIEFNLEELSQTVVRLRDQLRKFEMETEAQILHRHHERLPRREDFDPLEMDRYSMIQQLSRALAETASDVGSLQSLLREQASDAETLLTQQSRVISELQDGLMRTRMVPFSRHAQRLNRIVRQAARESGKDAELHIQGGTSELDRQVMERVVPAFEHLLRNAVIHGIEQPELRESRGKPPVGRIDINLRREGAEMIINIGDDGGGLDLAAIRRRAELQNLITPGEQISADAAAELILKPGFSTAAELTQSAGRGVGMDVVATAMREVGGSLQIETQEGAGTRFLIRLPYTRAITQALIVQAGDELFALPLPTVEGVVRLPASEISKHLADGPTPFRYGDRDYHFRHLATLVDGQAGVLLEEDANVPVILVRAGEKSTALLTDEMLGSREIVVKTLGPQLKGITGISGATILGDGSIVVILDPAALIRSRPEQETVVPAPEEAEFRDHRKFVMVVDDSITVRRVTERLLERNGMRVITAKDGVDAVALLQEYRPDIILLDIEMPRMDGYEVATHIRNDPRLKNIPIVMITSRVGQKHRSRAIESGVDDYLGKPYQENELLNAIEALTGDISPRGSND
ncbi:MAG: Hpt domain-containing protein [Gammaproteobacteria bacterium]|nr:MAG: Hpt domain-containing protein [Gammaproteobacteria bacterium]